MNNSGNFVLVICAVVLTIVICFVLVSQNQQIPNMPPPIYHNLPNNYPLGMEITSYLGNKDLEDSLVAEGVGEKLISVFHKVDYDEETKSFNYHYRVSFIGKERCFINWDVIDRMMNVSGSLIELEPNKPKEFKFAAGQPLLRESSAVLYRKVKVEDNDIWQLVRLNSQPMPIPE